MTLFSALRISNHNIENCHKTIDNKRYFLDNFHSYFNMKTNTKKWKIGWGVTNRCNMNCSFCYSKNARTDKQDLPFEKLKDFVDRNHYHIESINYGTGENTLSEEWYRLLDYIKSTFPEINQALTTNGYLTPALKMRRNAKRILRSLSEVDVSLDFWVGHRHNTLRNHAQAFEWAIDTIRQCVAEGIDTTIVIMGTNETLHIDNLKGIFKLAEETGCYVRINIYRPVSNNSFATTDYFLLKRAIKWILAHHKVVSLCDPLFSALILKKKFLDASGSSSLRILPDGSVTPSTYLISDEWRTAHIIDTDLGEITFAGPFESGVINGRIPVRCRSCEGRDLCGGGTIDRRYLWNKTLSEPDPYCPLLNHDTCTDWFHPEGVNLVKGPSIHDGYLPTMIFAP